MRELIYKRIEFWMQHFNITKSNMDKTSRFKGMITNYELLSDEGLVEWFEKFIRRCSMQM